MLAHLTCCAELAAGGQRIGDGALIVVFAADKALARTLGLMGDQIPMTARLGAHLALAHLKIGLVVGGALGVYALLVGLLAKRLALDPRRPALWAHSGIPLYGAHLHARRPTSSA